MFLRLYYTTSHPSLGFDVSLPDPPSNLPYPLGYILQLHRTSSEGLDLPTSVHALDKATWANTLVKEVAFSLITMSVTCTFIDGSQVQWPLEEVSKSVLQSVVDDVNEAAELTDRPYRHELQVSFVKNEKHKRQRSILKTLLSSLVHPDRSFSHYRKAAAAAPISSPPTPTKEPEITAPFLRKRARTTLVDAFRRYILSHLRVHMPEAGYFSWVAGSMLRRAESRLSILEANGLTPDMLPLDEALQQELEFGGCVPYEDDEETLSFGDSDTDDSSLHTPHESLVDHRDTWRAADADEDVHPEFDINDDRKDVINEYEDRQGVPRSPTPEPSKEEVAEYAALHSRCVHLRALLMTTDAAAEGNAIEHRSLLGVFEVKSRRRAWSARRYLGGAHVADAGFGTPYASSPLAYCNPVTPESLSREASSSSTASSSVLTPISEIVDDDAFTIVGDFDPDSTVDVFAFNPEDCPVQYPAASEYPRPVARRGDYSTLQFSEREARTPIPVHVFGRSYDEGASPEPNEFTLAVEMKSLSLGRRTP